MVEAALAGFGLDLLAISPREPVDAKYIFGVEDTDEDIGAQPADDREQHGATA
jgi:hypothetical protein